LEEKTLHLNSKGNRKENGKHFAKSRNNTNTKSEVSVLVEKCFNPDCLEPHFVTIKGELIEERFILVNGELLPAVRIGKKWITLKELLG
jgi:hypothetical protein